MFDLFPEDENSTRQIDHLTVTCSAARPPNESEAGANPALTEKLTAFLT